MQGNLTIDKETLYEENLSIKMEFNKLVDENRKLKTDILLLEVIDYIINPLRDKLRNMRTLSKKGK